MMINDILAYLRKDWKPKSYKEISNALGVLKSSLPKPVGILIGEGKIIRHKGIPVLFSYAPIPHRHKLACKFYKQCNCRPSVAEKCTQCPDKCKLAVCEHQTICKRFEPIGIDPEIPAMANVLYYKENREIELQKKKRKYQRNIEEERFKARKKAFEDPDIVVMRKKTARALHRHRQNTLTKFKNSSSKVERKILDVLSFVRGRSKEYTHKEILSRLTKKYSPKEVNKALIELSNKGWILSGTKKDNKGLEAITYKLVIWDYPKQSEIKNLLIKDDSFVIEFKMACIDSNKIA